MNSYINYLTTKFPAKGLMVESTFSYAVFPSNERRKSYIYSLALRFKVQLLLSIVIIFSILTYYQDPLFTGKLVLPISHLTHWVVAVYDFSTKSCTVYDSLLSALKGAKDNPEILKVSTKGISYKAMI